MNQFPFKSKLLTALEDRLDYLHEEWKRAKSDSYAIECEMEDLAESINKERISLIKFEIAKESNCDRISELQKLLQYIDHWYFGVNKERGLVAYHPCYCTLCIQIGLSH